MSKCQAKVEKKFPRIVWGTKKTWENCPNDAKGEGNFCEVHGCFDCSRRPVETCFEYEGVKLCLVCRGKREFEKKKEQERKKEIFKGVRKAFEKKKKEAEEKERLRKEAEEKERERERQIKRITWLKSPLCWPTTEFFCSN